MVETIKIPSGWTAEAEDPNHHIFKKSGIIGGERVHVIADTMQDEWQVQVEESGLFADDGLNTIKVAGTKETALQHAAQYMR
jgi:hypothetical protein